MDKIPKTPDRPARFQTILIASGVLFSIITIISTAIAVTPYIGSPSPVNSASAAPEDYRRLEEFSDDNARLAYAADLLNQGRYELAEVFLSDFLLTVEPDSHMAAAICYDRGLAYLYLRDYSQAASDFSIVTAQVDYADAYYNLGNAMTGLHEYRAALESYESALKLEQKPEYKKAKDAVLNLLGQEFAD